MSLESALALIESVKDTKVLFIGETIIDEYRFVSPLAKPSKENILAVRIENSETYCGGMHAAMTNAATFCKAMGNTVPSRIEKIRYVEGNYSRKLFEVQKFQPVTDHDREICRTDLAFADSEIVAVTDFGHGMFDKWTTDFVCRNAAFLAVACQTNAANAGFNLITKYRRADYIVIDEMEARLAACDRDSPLTKVIGKLADQCNCPKFVVTRGKRGAIGLCNGIFTEWEASPGEVLDTMGAGDAFFAVTAPMAKQGSMEDLLMIGNAAGALKCGILGHRESVTKAKLIEYLRANYESA